eukprot:g759.t1
MDSPPCEWSPLDGGDAQLQSASAVLPRGMVIPGGSSPSCAPSVTMYATGCRLRAALQAAFGVEACANGDVRMFRVEFPASGEIGLTLHNIVPHWLAASPAPTTAHGAQAQLFSQEVRAGQCAVLRTSAAGLSAAMGVRPGDVMMQINGQTLDTDVTVDGVGREITRCRRAGLAVSMTFARQIGKAGLGFALNAAQDPARSAVDDSVEGSVESLAGNSVDNANGAYNVATPMVAEIVSQSSHMRGKEKMPQTEPEHKIHRSQDSQSCYSSCSQNLQARPDDNIGRPSADVMETMQLMSSRALPHSISEARAKTESDVLMQLLQSPFKLKSTDFSGVGSKQSQLLNADATDSTEADLESDNNTSLRARLEVAEAQAVEASHWEMIRRKEVKRSNMAEAEAKEELATAHRLVGMLRTRLLEVQLQSRKGYTGEGDEQGGSRVGRIHREGYRKAKVKRKCKSKAKVKAGGKGKDT